MQDSARRHVADFLETTQNEASGPAVAPLIRHLLRKGSARPYKTGDKLSVPMNLTHNDGAFIVTDQLGAGCFSRIFRVRRVDSPLMEYALKVVQLDAAAPNVRVQLLAELEVLKRLRGTRNVVDLIGR